LARILQPGETMNAIAFAAPAATPVPALGWYRLAPSLGRAASIVRLVRIEDFRGMSMAVCSGGGGTSSQRVDFWVARVERAATPAEIADAIAADAADGAYMARAIDTSREGT
jgi:hypothetical protein